MAERKNINEATREDVAKLPFMNASRAEMIIHYREVHGPFKTEDDIAKVTGINERLAARVAEYFDIGEVAEPDEDEGESTQGSSTKARINREAEEEEVAANESRNRRRSTAK